MDISVLFPRIVVPRLVHGAGSTISRLWLALSSAPAGTGVLFSPAIGPVNWQGSSPRPGFGFFPMFVGTRKAKGISSILVTEKAVGLSQSLSLEAAEDL